MAKTAPKTLKCSTRRIQVQNDLRDWELDRGNKPVKVTNEKYWLLKQISVDPKYIPKEKISLEKVTIVKDADNKDVEVIEQLDPEKAIKEAFEKEIAKTEEVIDIPVDPIKGAKP